MDSDEELEFEGVYVPHWEVERFVVVRGRKLFGLLPRVEKWRVFFPADFELPHSFGRGEPARFYRMRVRGRVGPRGNYGHRGVLVREVRVSEVLACEETRRPGRTW